MISLTVKPDTLLYVTKLLLITLTLTWICLACAENEQKLVPAETERLSKLETLCNQYIKGDTAVFTNIHTLLSSCDKRESACIEMATTALNTCDDLLNLGMLDYVEPLLKLVHAQSMQIGNATLILDVELELAWMHLLFDEPDSVHYYLNNIQQYPENAFTQHSRAILYNTQASLALKEKKYPEAIEKYLDAYQLLEGTRSKQEQIVIENIGSLYNELQNYPRALSFYRKALPAIEQSRDTGSLIVLYNNLATCFKGMDSLDKAAGYYVRALTLAKPNSFHLTYSLTNYGNVLRRQARYDEALAAIDSSLRISESLDIPVGLTINRLNKSHVLLDMNRFAEAAQLLQLIEPVADQYTDQIHTEFYRLSALAYARLGDKSRAYDYLNQHITLRNELQALESERMLMAWEERYWQTKNKAILAEKEHQLETALFRQRIIVIFSMVMLLLTVAVGVIYYLNRQRQVISQKLWHEESENLRLELELKEREIAGKAIHLQSIGGFVEDISTKLSMLKDKLGNENAEELSKIIRDFDQGIPEELWDDFRLRFEKMNETFNQKLLNLAPDLTPVEIKIASFLRLNLSSKEISKLTNRSAGTISNTRSSLRKKLKLEEDDNLVAFLLSL